MKKILIILLIFCILPIQKVNAVDDDITPNAKSAILIEANSKQILYQKNAQEKLYPASTTKIMTMILIVWLQGLWGQLAICQILLKS